MQILTVSAAAIEEALATLGRGGIVAHATETCYGLACDLSNPKAVEKLFQIKQRPENQPVSVLFSSIAEAKKYVQWNDEAEKLANEFLPGPLTLILPMRSDAPKLQIVPIFNFQFSIFNSIGLRVSSHPLATSLAQRFGKPLSTTSANIHGFPNTYSAEEIVAQFKDQLVQPDLILDAGTLPKNPPSKIIDLTAGGIVRREAKMK